MADSPHPSDLVTALRTQLAETQGALDALRSGAVDAFVDGFGDVRPLPGSERSYLAFFHAMGEGGATLDPEGNVLDCNPRFLAMLGAPIDALRGTPFLGCVHAEQREAVAALLASPASSASDVTLEGWRGPVPVQLSVEPVVVGSERFTCLVITDLSERVRAESELRIAAIAFDSQDGIIVTDAHGHIVRVNGAFERRTGYTAAQLLGKTAAVFHSGRHSRVFYEAMWRELLERGYWQGEIWNRARNEQVYAEWLTISAVRSPGGTTTHYVGTYSEVSRNREAQAEIYRLAYYDSLTHLPNRRLLHDRLAHALAACTRNGRLGALLFVDLDGFKQLNDSCGHDVGDQVLVETARRLRARLREVDTVARHGGDEFVVILEDLHPDPSRAALQARQVGEKLRDALAQAHVVGLHELRCSVSIGITLFRSHDESLDGLLKQADLALYRAKAAGRNAVSFFDPGVQAAFNARSSLESALRGAVDRDELRLLYQPQFDIHHRVVGVEALVRWHHPELGTVMPGEFIPLAEEAGLIEPIGRWVTEAACDQIRAWSGAEATRGLKVAVNVSAKQFQRSRFATFVTGALADHGADPSRLTLELTESAVPNSVTEVLEIMRELKGAGVGFALDDFGTGSSCLSYLSRLPLDQLKIDRSFVLNLPRNRNDAIIAQTIITMATSLGLGVVAEGVETPEQLRFLEEHACEAFQGYLLGRPLPAAELERRLADDGSGPQDVEALAA